MLSFAKERRVAYFHSLKLRAVLFRIYGLDSICRFYYICGFNTDSLVSFGRKADSCRHGLHY